MKPTMDTNGGGGGGGSRAAKKRAKKKQKKNKKNEEKPPKPIIDDADVDDREEAEAVLNSKKRPLIEEKEDVEMRKDDKIGVKKNNAKKKQSSSSGGGGILKKSKYAVGVGEKKNKNAPEELNDETAESDAPTNDIVLPEIIQELLKSNEVNLKEILLLDNHDEDNKISTKQQKQKKKKQEAADSDSDEEEDDDENQFQQLTSKERARCVLNLLLAPADLTAEDFYEEYWEKKALCVQQPKKTHQSDKNQNAYSRRFDGLLSLKKLRKWTQQHTLFYGRDLNVTRYHSIVPGEPKRRANIDPPPYQDTKTGETQHVQVDSDFVWDQYDNHNATLRLLCPHKQHDTVHALLSLLEFEWGCMVGANAYLTPPGASQGFAPHFDDIEAFCLQLEGRKRWKVYAPTDNKEKLPRVSSEDYTEEDMQDQEPVLDVVLEPGDLLYMPRGWIHQGITLGGSKEHSLHLTISAMQQWAWVDYLELLLPEALEAAANSETSTSLRQGLPRNFLDYMGAIHDQRDSDLLPDKLKQDGGGGKKKAATAAAAASSGDGRADEEDEDEENIDEAQERQRIQQMQEKFRAEAKRKILLVAKEAMDMVDAACDQIGKRFLSDRLPPGFTPEEKACTSEGQRDEKIWPTTLCRLARPGIARLCLEDGKAVLYHCNDNSRMYHEVPLSPMEFEVDDAPALEQLITTIEPSWIPVSDLIHEGMEDKIAIAQSLYDEGILAIVNPAGGPMQ